MKKIRIVHGTLMYPLEVGSRALIFEEEYRFHTVLLRHWRDSLLNFVDRIDHKHSSFGFIIPNECRNVHAFVLPALIYHFITGVSTQVTS